MDDPVAVRQQSEQPLHPSSYSDTVPQAVGDAVLVALDSDPDRRFAAAGELADALRRGLDGESPTASEAPTRMVAGDPPTSATRRMPRTQTRRPARRPAPAPRQPRRAAQRSGRSRSSSAARNLAALIVLLLLAAVVAGLVVLLSTDSGQSVNVENVVKENIQDQIDTLRQVIEDNTK